MTQQQLEYLFILITCNGLDLATAEYFAETTSQSEREKHIAYHRGIR